LANVSEQKLSEEQIITALDTLNNHPFVAGAVTFVLDTSVNPWVVNVLDNDGNVTTSIPPKRMVEISDNVNKLPPPGVAVDIEV